MQNLQQNSLVSTQPLISFIIPYYKVEYSLVVECLQSIIKIADNNQEIEIIIVDDCDENNIENRLKTRFENIVYIRNEENKGLGEARNIGLKHSCGEYIQFVDADDYLFFRTYKQIATYIKQCNPDLLMFNFGESENNTLIKYRAVGDGITYMTHNNIRGTACLYVFKKNIIQGVEFPKKTLHEDEQFTPLIIANAKSVVKTNAIAYHYRVRQNSIMHEVNSKHINKRLFDMEKIIDFLDSYRTENILKRAAIQRRTAQLTMDYIYNVIKLTRNKQILEEKIQKLKNKKLYPLPNIKCTLKYHLFRIITLNKAGRAILFKLLR